MKSTLNATIAITVTATVLSGQDPLMLVAAVMVGAWVAWRMVRFAVA